MTGFTPKTRHIICWRAEYRCERCTQLGVEVHHRRPRGMGGSKDWLTNSPANGVLLCSDCHRFIELNRTKALALGWLVLQGQDPQNVPVYYRGSQWVKLTIDGDIDVQTDNHHPHADVP